MGNINTERVHVEDMCSDVVEKLEVVCKCLDGKYYVSVIIYLLNIIGFLQSLFISQIKLIKNNSNLKPVKRTPN